MKKVLQDQIAATVSFFLGYRLPTGLTGGIPFDVFNVDERRKAIYQISLAEIKSMQFQWFAEQFNLKEKYENDILRLEGNLTNAKQFFLQGKYGEALDVAEKIEDDCENLIKEVWEENHSKEVSSRLQTASLIYVAILAPLIVITFVLRRKINWKIFSTAILSALGYFLGFWASFFASGWYFSISLFYSPEEFVGGMMVFVIAGLVVAGLTTGLAAIWSLEEKNRWVKVVLAALLGLVLAVVINTIYISFYGVRWNYVLDWYFPEGRAWGDTFAYYLMLAQNAYLSIFFAITPVVALTVSTIISKLSKKQKVQE